MPPTLSKRPTRCAKCNAWLAKGSLVLSGPAPICAACAGLRRDQELFPGADLGFRLVAEVAKVEKSGFELAREEQSEQMALIESEA